MKIAYNDIKYKEKIQKYDAIYIFDENDNLEDLLKLNVHCIRKDAIDYVDINTTNYKIPCMRKMKIEDDFDLDKKQDYKFAIIVPNYNNDHGEWNGKTFLKNCIDSILEQTYKNFELIIVDDMSTDTSVESVENYADNRIHLIKNTRKRYNGGSRNVGLDYAFKNLDFDYIVFLDSDDAWKDENVLQTINDNLFNAELLLIGIELLFPDGHTQIKLHEYDNYKDFFFSENKVWCTAWSRIIRKDKIVYFPESTLMEDRTWSYEQADNVDIDNVINLQKPMYIWNRCNTTNSVSLVRGELWRASAYKHIGQQIALCTRLKHKEFIPDIQKRIRKTRELIDSGDYKQY